MSGTDKAWELWGQLDPYYGVVTDDRFKRGHSDDMRRQFFDSGEQYVSDVLASAQRRFGATSHRRALDFGSGVGRLAIPFSKRFSTVVGVDISDAMIAEAKRNCDEFNVTNVSFVKSDDQLSRLDGTFDFINSYVVLQHIPVSRGMRLVDCLLARLEVGGIAMLHFSFERRLSRFVAFKYFMKHYVPGARFLYNLSRNQPANRPSMEMNEYSMVKVVEAFNRNGVSEVNVSLETFDDVVCARLMGQRT